MSSWYVVDMMAALYFSWCWRQSLLVCSKYRALHDVFEWLGMWFGDVCHQKCWRHPSANTRYFRYLKMLNDMMQSKPAVSLYFPQPLFSDCSVDQYQHIKRKQKKTHSNQIRDYKRGFPEFVFEMFRDGSRWFEMFRDVLGCFESFHIICMLLLLCRLLCSRLAGWFQAAALEFTQQNVLQQWLKRQSIHPNFWILMWIGKASLALSLVWPRLFPYVSSCFMYNAQYPMYYIVFYHLCYIIILYV